MTSNDFVADVIARLEKANTPCLLVGSWAANFFGLSRCGDQADLLVAGPLLDVADGTTRSTIPGPTGISRVDLYASDGDAFDVSRFARRVKRTLGGREVSVESAEDFIVQKCRWFAAAGREKDRGDARTMLAVRIGRLDLGYVRFWCEQHVTRELFEALHDEVKLMVR